MIIRCPAIVTGNWEGEGWKESRGKKDDGRWEKGKLEWGGEGGGNLEEAAWKVASEIVFIYMIVYISFM